jgi:2-amino-4-hydroxy-6-hydroxymethyldihydropteridine diphosphokinase
VPVVYLGLGSNLGDRHATLDSAIARLAESGFRNLRQSSRYETAPVGFLDQPWFLNMVVEAETDLSAEAALGGARAVEKALGRKRTFRNGPRVIDIDLLLYGDCIRKQARLTLPHPRMRERRFVLDPLVELKPDLIDPVSNRRFADFLAELTGQAIHKLPLKPALHA